MRIGNEEPAVGRTIVMRDEPRELVHEPGDLASAAAHASVGTAENGNVSSRPPRRCELSQQTLSFSFGQERCVIAATFVDPLPALFGDA
jgi:hypothetical protein